MVLYAPYSGIDKPINKEKTVNYKPGDKVRVTVNGAIWEDEISYTRVERFCGDGAVMKLSDDLNACKNSNKKGV
jgi:hypothetical protein